MHKLPSARDLFLQRAGWKSPKPAPSTMVENIHVTISAHKYMYSYFITFSIVQNVLYTKQPTNLAHLLLYIKVICNKYHAYECT